MFLFKEPILILIRQLRISKVKGRCFICMQSWYTCAYVKVLFPCCLICFLACMISFFDVLKTSGANSIRKAVSDASGSR